MKALWPPKDIRAFLALVATVAGAAALTAFAVWVVWIIWHGGWADDTQPARIAILGRGLTILLVGILIVICSLGLAINRREIKVSRQGIEMSGGDDDTKPPEAQP